MLDYISLFFTTGSLDIALAFVSEYQIFVALTIPILLGEAGLYLFGVLSGIDSQFYSAIIISVISIVFYELLMYVVVTFLKNRHNLVERIEKMPVLRLADAVFKKCQQQHPDNPLMVLFALKTLPMTKVSIFFFLLRYNIPIGQFMLKDLFITALWTLPIVIPGWLAGRGFLSYTEGRMLWKFILLFVLFLLIMWFLNKYIQKAVAFVIQKVQKRETDEVSQ